MDGFENGLAVVTGAAGGMGSAIARAFAEEGRPLVLSDRTAGPIEALAANLTHGASVQIVCGDVTDADYPARILSAVGPRKIGALVHAAGVSPSMAEGRRIFAINFTATRHLVQAVLTNMAPGGAVILIASNSGQLIARPMFDRAIKKLLNGRRSRLVEIMSRNPRAAYPLSKRAVQLYAQFMSPAFGAHAARIVSLSPGIIDTEMGRLEQKAGPEMQKMISLTPAGRSGNSEEIASVVAFLASSGASYISGTDILVDGGCVAGISKAGGVMKAMSRK